MTWYQNPDTVHLSVQCDTAALQELDPTDVSVILTEHDLAVEVRKSIRLPDVILNFFTDH